MSRSPKTLTGGRVLLPGVALVAALVTGTQPVPADGSGKTVGRQFEIAETPAWVVPLKVDAAEKPATEKLESGEYYLLLDTQVNATNHESYSHTARLLLNSTGVQNGAQISIQFDPSYQQLTIHCIKIHRGAETFDRLDADKIKVIQQERELERHTYNGALSAVLFLEDLRPGDWVEYAFTIRGENPIMAGHFEESFLARWPMPVRKQRFRLLWNGDRKLHIKSHGTQCQPVISQSGTAKEYVWQFENAPAVNAEDSLPVWYDAYPWVQLSDFSSWREVALWAEPIYRLRDPLSPELQDKIAAWQSKYSKPEERVLAALHFVQDDVRYLAIEFGLHSHQPTAPATVFARRYGDCKDKTFLFCAMLQAMGIEAHPTLVNTFRRHTVDDWEPSPYTFDHVITEVKLNGRNVWLDATRSFQRGSVENLPISTFERGLVVGENTTGLATIPPATTETAKTIVTKTYRILNYTNPVEFTVETIFAGTEAEEMRASIAESRTSTLEKNYLNYYAKYHPKIEVAEPMEVRDMPERNSIVLTQHYRISDLWQLSENKEKWVCEFFPQAIHDAVKKPYTVIRSMPLGIAYPYHVIEVFNVYLPERFALTNGSQTVADDSMTFHAKVDYQQPKLTLTYDYETLTDMLPADEVSAHLKNLDRLNGELGYAIQRTVLGSPGRPAPYRPNWPMWFITIIYSILLLIGAVLVYRYRPKRSANEPPVIKLRRRGIGGWLIVMMCTLGLRVLAVGATVAKNHIQFSLSAWENLTVPGHVSYHAMWAPMLIFEFLANLTLLAGGILACVLFFEKRRTFPRFYLAVLVAHPIVILTDLLLCLNLPAITAENQANSAIMLARAVVFGLIWGAYLLNSRRVKETFVK